MKLKHTIAATAAVLAIATPAAATPHDYVCTAIADKLTAAEAESAQCFECAEASAYFVENPLDSTTFFETCDVYGGIVDWIEPWSYWEPWEEVPLTIEDCVLAMNRAERLQTLYDANCL